MPDPFEIVVGTYEQYVLGYKVNSIVNEYKMERTFATHSHVASVRSIATNKHYLTSGGADDSVCLYNMRYRLESGKLVHHNDTVNCIAFTPEASHMFTCSNDGSIVAIRCGNWQIDKHWKKPHKGLAVNTMAIHPTGKIALSTGADGILRTWNLVKGRQAYATNLTPRLKLDARNVTVLKWSPNGEKYLLAVNQRIDIYSVELAGIDSEIKLDAKIICVEFLRDNLIAVGLENGQIRFYDLEKSEQTVEALAHDIRVKCMAFKENLLVTASSSGEIKLWRYSKNRLDMLQSVNCGARITCLTLAMSCNNIVRYNEVKLEDEQEQAKHMKFRLRQEVVIEKEGDWDVTSVAIPRTGLMEKKKKKRRSTGKEDAPSLYDKKKKVSTLKKKVREEGEKEEEECCIIMNVPKKKKKSANWMIENEQEIIVEKKKRETDRPSSKGAKALNGDGNFKVDNVTVKRLKKKSIRSKENDEEVHPEKRRKTTTIESTMVGTIAKKKKNKKKKKIKQ